MKINYSKGTHLSNEILLSKLDKYNAMFIAEKKLLNSSNSTITTYLHILERFYEYIVESDVINSLEYISKTVVLGFANKDATAANATRILYLTVIKSYLSFIDEKEKLNGMFEHRLKKLTIKKESVEVDALDDIEVEKLLGLFSKKTKSFNKHRDSLLIKLILFTGIRASECLDIKLKDLSLIEENSVYKIKILGKGSKERFVYIAVERIENELLFLKDYIVNYIAITNQQKRMSRVGLYKVISNKMKKAGINKKGVHILRHTFARRLVAKNINLVTISELLGHADITLTAKTYARSNEGNKIRAVLL